MENFFQGSAFLAPLSFLARSNNYVQISLPKLGRCNVKVGEDGKPRALSNACAHRGTEIITEVIGDRKLVCPYHGWRYNRSGNLLPNLSVGSNSPICLASKDLSVRRGFVTTSEPENIEELKNAFEFIGTNFSKPPFHFESLTHTANWKWLVENVTEAYHLDFVHKNTFVKKGFLMSDKIVNTKSGSSSSAYLPHNKSSRIFYKHAYVWPNLFMSNTSDLIYFCSVLLPRSDYTTDLIWFLFSSDKLETLPKVVAKQIMSQSIEFTRTALFEDKAMVERQQIGCGETRNITNLTENEIRIKWFRETLMQKGLI